MTERSRASSLDVLSVVPSSTVSGSLTSIWSAFQEGRDRGDSPFVSAVNAAAHTDRLGFAFAVGYPAALESLVPGVEFPAALCVTEAAGNSPRATETTLEPNNGAFVLRGTKSFVTFGNLATTLIVSARIGVRPDGRPSIVAVRVPAGREGVRLEELPDTPFVPEVPHAAVRFEDVAVSPEERLAGDGYLDYVKRFRTVEDIHVAGATIAYLVGLARRVGAPVASLAGLTADLVALEQLSSQPPLDPRVHVALHGVYSRLETFVSGEEFSAILESAAADERTRWARDQRLLQVAGKAREARFARAIDSITE
ncbi:MAG: acyl-CoA dehydrogenase family protein [Myxococcota bacterium]